MLNCIRILFVDNDNLYQSYKEHSYQVSQYHIVHKKIPQFQKIQPNHHLSTFEDVKLYLKQDSKLLQYVKIFSEMLSKGNQSIP